MVDYALDPFLCYTWPVLRFPTVPAHKQLPETSPHGNFATENLSRSVVTLLHLEKVKGEVHIYT